MKSRTDPFDSFVEHPRYGRAPRLTGLDVQDSPDGKVYCHWHSPVGVRVPGTAVAADVSRQARATVPVTHYYDAKRTCRRCGRPFLFFADEQKHWYETLRFPLEADCVECVECRKDEQRLRVLQRRYEELSADTSRDEAATLELVECAITLAEVSVFSKKVLPKLRGFLNPLMRDPEGPFVNRARALAARIDALN